MVNVDQCFQKSNMTSSNVLFCPQKDIQFTVREEERNQKIFTFKRLKLENFDYFSPDSKRLINNEKPLQETKERRIMFKITRL